MTNAYLIAACIGWGFFAVVWSRSGWGNFFVKLFLFVMWFWSLFIWMQDSGFVVRRIGL